MKHIAKNKDGSTQVYDETEDGFFLVMWATIRSAFRKRWKCAICGRKYFNEEEAINCCWICLKCGKEIHTYVKAYRHSVRCRGGKNGKKQTRKTV